MKTFLPPLNSNEEQYYLEKMNQGDLEARSILIEHNLRLVVHICKKYQSVEEELEDLISIGSIGLIKAIGTFSSEKGNRLATYAARCIDNAILSQMRLWFQTNLPRAEKQKNGVFCRRFPRIFTSFAPLRTTM